MIPVVAGPSTSRFPRFIAKIVTIGAKTLYLFFSARNPARPDSVDPKCDELPGYVNARMTGRAV